MTATAAANTVPLGTEVPRGIGMTGRVAVAWAVAGGIGLGGFVVALMTLGGRLSGNGLLVTSMALFIIGAVLGFLHGAVLGIMGRPEGMSWRRAVGALGLAAMYAVPALTVGFLVAGWIALTAIAIYTGKVLAIAGCTIAWVAGAGLLTYAAVEGWRALRAAYHRWSEARYGTLVVATSFAALLVLFLVDRPVIWGINLRVTEVGAVLLALSLTLWFVGPFVTVALKLVKRIAAPALVPVRNRVAVDVALGLVAGAVLGLIAVPFASAKYGIAAAAPETGAAGAIVVAISAALVNEVLLRLFLLTAVAALILRRHQARRDEAAVLAIAFAAIVQVALYLPGVIAIGFPSTLSASAFMLAGVALPAIVFGALFWKRGLMTAVVADATALVAFALLAA